jgi:ATP-binding cassette subfamily F protein 3
MRDAEARLGQLEPNDPRLQAALEDYATLQERFERAGGYDTPQRIEQALARFGLDANQVLEHLSPAQHQQLALALGLLRASSFADVLLLDEPERHLDLSSRQQLVAALQALPVALVLASHDRALLDAVAKRVAYVAEGSVQLYRGNYSAFLRQHDSERVRLARLVHQRRQERQALEQTRIGAPTPDARKRARARLNKLEPVPTFTSTSATSLPLGYETRPAETLLRVQKLHVRQLENLSFQLTAGITVALVGAHGAGKTTLLEAIAGKLESRHPATRVHWAKDAKLAYFDAEAGLDEAPLLGQLEAFVSAMRARSLLALVGLAQHADNTPAQLSSGQRARAGLAKVMAQDATVLLLDNPSEHLDLDMTAVLENALLDSPAAILLATHDAALIERVADQVWWLEAGMLHVYANLAAYQRGEALPNLAEPQHNPAQAVLLADDVNGVDASTTPADAAAQEDALEQQLATLDEALLDPLRHSERERERLTLRRKQVLDDLSWCYEQRQPAPLPAYSAREGVIQVWLDIDAREGSDQMMRVATFNSNAAVHGRVFIQQYTGHVQWQLPDDGCVLPWALERVVWGLVRIVFMHLELQVVQTQVNVPLPGFQDAGEGWQTLTRKGFMQLEGYPAFPTR